MKEYTRLVNCKIWFAHNKHTQIETERDSSSLQRHLAVHGYASIMHLVLFILSLLSWLQVRGQTVVKPDLTCPEGFRLTSRKNCVKEICVEPQYYCPEGSTLNGKDCVLKDWYRPQALCPGGARIDESRRVCRVPKTNRPMVHCPEGYQNRENEVCVHQTITEAVVRCPDGFALSVDVVSLPVMSPHAAPPPPVVMIDTRTLVHDVSPPYSPMGSSSLSRYSYSESLPSSPRQLVGSAQKCVRRTNSDPILSCPASHKRVGNDCVQREKSHATGKCPDGFDAVNATSCARFLPAFPVPQCEEGFKLVGHDCVHFDNIPATPACSDGGQYDGDLCRAEEIAVVEMRCPDQYTFDPQLRKCLRVLERDPIPTCLEGFRIKKTADIDSRMRHEEGRAHQKTGVFHVDHVCYRLQVQPPNWLCPRDGQLSGRSGKDGPLCDVTSRVEPLQLCPAGSEASQNGECIAKQTIDMRYECPNGFRIDPFRRQCFKNHVLPPKPSCRRGTLQRGQCVEVDVTPAEAQCKGGGRPVGGKKCVMETTIEAKFKCGTSGVMVQEVDTRKGGSGGPICQYTEDIPAKVQCEKSGPTSGEVNGMCWKYRMIRPDIRCPGLEYYMDLYGKCVKHEETEAKPKCRAGYVATKVGSEEKSTIVCIKKGAVEKPENGGSYEERANERNRFREIERRKTIEDRGNRMGTGNVGDVVILS